MLTPQFGESKPLVIVDFRLLIVDLDFRLALGETHWESHSRPPL
jgi:hypothetical protein